MRLVAFRSRFALVAASSGPSDALNNLAGSENPVLKIWQVGGVSDSD